MDRLQHSDSFGIKVQGAHYLQSKAMPPSKKKIESSVNVFQNSNNMKDAGHFVSMTSSKFGANILGQMKSVEQVQSINQKDFSEFLNNSSAGQRKTAIDQRPMQRLSPQNEYVQNMSFINRQDFNTEDPNLFHLIGVQKLQLSHESKPMPVNYDKKKAKKKFDSKSPTQEGVDQPRITNQQHAAANDASFFSQPKQSIEKSNDDKRSLLNQSFKQGKGYIERFNEHTYVKSPARLKTRLYDHNLQKATMGDSTSKGNYKNATANNELEDMSEFNNSLKMSIHKPIYSGGNNSINPPKHNFAQLKSFPLKNSRVTLADRQEDPIHQASLATTQFDQPLPNSLLHTQDAQTAQTAQIESMQAQTVQIKFLELKRFIFQLDNIVEFCNDEAADSDTIIMMIEQCLYRKVYLNPKHMTVQKLRRVCEQIVNQVNQELNIRGIASNDLESQENCLKKDFSKNIQIQVKQLIRDYFVKLAQQENQQQKSDLDEPKTGKNSHISHKPSNQGHHNTQSIGIAAQSSFDVSHLNHATEGQMQITLEAPDGQPSLDQDHEQEAPPTRLISPVEADAKEIGTEDPTLQKVENTASDPEDEPMDGKMDQLVVSVEDQSPSKYLLDEDLEELEQIQSGGDQYQMSIDLIKLQKGVEFAELEKQLQKFQEQEQYGEKKKGNESINEIIVKIEMKKFQNLINNRLQRKNNLVSTDITRIFPLNKITDGSARQVEVISGFHEGLLKMNPKLFTYYEKINKKVKKDAQSLMDVRRSVSPNSKAFSSQIKMQERDFKQFNSSIPSNTQVLTNDNSQRSFLPVTVPTTSYGQKRDSLINYAGANQSPPPQTAHQAQRASYMAANNKRRSQQHNAWRQQAWKENENQDLNYQKQRLSYEQFQTLSMKSKNSMISSLNPQNIGLKKTLGASVGVAGKRQPTTYVVNETGDIGVIKQEEHQGVISPMSVKDRKIYEHERTISEFAQRHISKAQRLKQKAQEETLSHYERKNNINMPLLQSQSAHQRQRSMQQHYNTKPTALTVKNKYGLSIPLSNKGGNISNLANSQSLTLGSQRQTLAQQYRIPDKGKYLLESSRQSSMSENYGMQSVLFNNDSEANVEPFGWKIGLKDRAGPYHEQQARQQHQRHLQLLRNQKRQQDNLQNGIDKLTHNQFYRQMYEKFKDRQSKYPNELARILTEDCQPGTSSAGESTQESKANLGAEKNPIKRLSKQGQN